MAMTNFGALTANQLTTWSREFWHEARNKTFIMRFAGDSANSMIQRITELRKTKDGARAVVTLINEATGDGVVGDNDLEGNEEALSSSDMVIQLDQWRKAHKSAGKMAEQKSIAKFRREAKDALSYAASRVMDELAFQTLSGISYGLRPNGSTRTGQLPLLSFAADVAAPTNKRHLRWDKTGGLSAGDTSQVDAIDLPTYQMLVDAKAYAVNNYIKPIRSDDGVEHYNVFMCPDGIAALKKDPDFIAAWREAQKRGDSNPLFKGTKHGGGDGIHIDGLNILEYRNVFNTRGAAAGSKWGAGGAIDGQRILLMGAQALAFADIGDAEWAEKDFDYGNRQGIAIGKILGFLKPQLFSTYNQSKQDFGVVCIDTGLPVAAV